MCVRQTRTRVASRPASSRVAGQYSYSSERACDADGQTLTLTVTDLSTAHRHTPGTHNHTQTPAEQGRRGQARQTHEVFRTRPTRRASKRARPTAPTTNQSSSQPAPHRPRGPRAGDNCNCNCCYRHTDTSHGLQQVPSPESSDTQHCSARPTAQHTRPLSARFRTKLAAPCLTTVYSEYALILSVTEPRK